MKRFFDVFVLTQAEQRLVVVLVTALVIGAWIKHRGEGNAYKTPLRDPASSAIALVSPTPSER